MNQIPNEEKCYLGRPRFSCPCFKRDEDGEDYCGIWPTEIIKNRKRVPSCIRERPMIVIRGMFKNEEKDDEKL